MLIRLLIVQESWENWLIGACLGPALYTATCQCWATLVKLEPLEELVEDGGIKQGNVRVSASA